MAQEGLEFEVVLLPDSRTYGYVARKGTSLAVIYNGNEVAEFDQNYQTYGCSQEKCQGRFGGGIAFFGKTQGKDTVVFSGVARQVRCGNDIVGPMMWSAVSPNGQRFACIEPGVVGKGSLLHGDDATYGPFDVEMEPETLVISDDGGVAVAAKRGGRGGEETWLLITGPQAGTAFRAVSPPALAPDGKAVVYLAVTDQGKLLLFVGGALKRQYDGYSYDVSSVGKQASFSRGPFGWPPTVSSDGQSVAFAAKKTDAPNGECVMVDDRCGEIFDQIVTQPKFIDGTHAVFYEALTASHERFVVVGDRKYGNSGGGWDRTPGAVLSVNGKTVADAWNVARVQFGERGLTPLDEGHILVNGVDRKAIGLVDELALSPDGESLAYVAHRRLISEGNRVAIAGYVVVRGDRAGQVWDQVQRGSLTFSPSGKSLAYVAHENREQYVVINEKKSEPFDLVLTPLIYSPDGSKLAFGARKGRQILWKVLPAAASSNTSVPKSPPTRK